MIFTAWLLVFMALGILVNMLISLFNAPDITGSMFLNIYWIDYIVTFVLVAVALYIGSKEEG